MSAQPAKDREPNGKFAAGNTVPHGRRSKSPYEQAVEWQRLLSVKAKEPDLKPGALAMLSRAWKEQEELKRKMKLEPDPKAVDTEAMAARRARRTAPAPMSFDPSVPTNQ